MRQIRGMEQKGKEKEVEEKGDRTEEGLEANGKRGRHYLDYRKEGKGN